MHPSGTTTASVTPASTPMTSMYDLSHQEYHRRSPRAKNIISLQAGPALRDKLEYRGGRRQVRAVEGIL